MIRRALYIGGTVIVFACALICFGNDIAIAFENDAPSRSVGTPSSGRLENGKRLPSGGPNYTAYARIGTLLGRNAVNGRVRRAVLEGFDAVYQSDPSKRFVYGETGWPSGGRFRPHLTHQNGLSVDFMVPVLDRSGRSVPLPTGLLNKYGYGIEFDSGGRWDDYRIDFEAMGTHLLALDEAAKANGLSVELVILAPELQKLLWATP